MFNAEKSITAALDSVTNQTWEGKFEVVVIDDGSSDNSKKRVEDFIKNHPEIEIKLIHQENKGVSAARNVGLKNATANFIALLDADDEWLPEKTEIQMKYLLNNLHIDFLACTRNNQKLLFPYNTKQQLVEVNLKKLLFRNEITIPSVIFKRKILDNTGFFTEGQNHAEDVDFYLRISAHNRMFILNQSLVITGSGKRSFGVSGLSADLKKMAKGFRENIKRLYRQGRINGFQYFLYYVFYGLKYIFLLTRNTILNRFDKQSK
jgi:glycosyltransferase involved in cell wall biosynthesis